jgi:hypothetical protein
MLRGRIKRCEILDNRINNPSIRFKSFQSQNLLVMALETYHSEVVASLEEVGLAPGSIPLIPQDFKVTIRLDVMFGEKSVSLGNFLKTSETSQAPSISFASETEV